MHARAQKRARKAVCTGAALPTTAELLDCLACAGALQTGGSGRVRGVVSMLADSTVREGWPASRLTPKGRLRVIHRGANKWRPCACPWHGSRSPGLAASST